MQVKVWGFGLRASCQGFLTFGPRPKPQPPPALPSGELLLVVVLVPVAGFLAAPCACPSPPPALPSGELLLVVALAPVAGFLADRRYSAAGPLTVLFLYNFIYARHSLPGFFRLLCKALQLELPKPY